MDEEVRQAERPVVTQEPFEVKDSLRVMIRARRAKVPEKARQDLAEQIAKAALSVPVVSKARCVAAYANRPTEPGTLPLIRALESRGMRILLPKLGSGLARTWADYAGEADLQVRAPGRPPEPGGDDLGPQAIANADVLLIPAVAVDTSGTRLGQGGGWYDRAVDHAKPGTPILAIVYDEELLDVDKQPIPRQEHDRLVDGVITPSGWRWLRLPDK